MHVIDCSTVPFIPGSSELLDDDQLPGRFRDRLEWRPEKVRLLGIDPVQSGSVSGWDLRLRLFSRPVLPANVLDYLLERPEMIPREWQGSCVWFWGTLYRTTGGHLIVRCLYRDAFNPSRPEWRWSSKDLNSPWWNGDMAALSGVPNPQIYR